MMLSLAQLDSLNQIADWNSIDLPTDPKSRVLEALKTISSSCVECDYHDNYYYCELCGSLGCSSDDLVLHAFEHTPNCPVRVIHDFLDL